MILPTEKNVEDGIGADRRKTLPMNVALAMHVVKSLQHVPQYEGYGSFRKTISKVTRQQVFARPISHQRCYHNHLRTRHKRCVIWQYIWVL